MDIDPLCPFSMADEIISTVSSPRTSPTMILSGLILRAERIRSLIVTAPSPSGFAPLASSFTRFSTPLICISALSSIVMIRSSFGIKSDIAFKNVVFPAPVPPLTKILYFAITNFLMNCAASSVILPQSISFFIVNGSSGNVRIVRIGPFTATGFMTTLTRDPSFSLASTIGEASLTYRFASPTICWITSTSLSSDMNFRSYRNNRPPFS